MCICAVGISSYIVSIIILHCRFHFPSFRPLTALGAMENGRLKKTTGPAENPSCTDGFSPGSVAHFPVLQFKPLTPLTR